MSEDKTAYEQGKEAGETFKQLLSDFTAARDGFVAGLLGVGSPEASADESKPSDQMGRFTFDGAEGIAFHVYERHGDDPTCLTEVTFSELDTLAAFLRHNFPGLFDTSTDEKQGCCGPGEGCSEPNCTGSDETSEDKEDPDTQPRNHRGVELYTLDQARRIIADTIMRNCTLQPRLIPNGPAQPHLDSTVDAVAAWISNPPAWVEFRPATVTSERLAFDARVHRSGQ